MQQVLVVRAIIKVDGRTLIVRRSQGSPRNIGLYELPGGKVDFGEDPKAALEREVQEETGLILQTIQLADVYSHLDASDAQKQYVSLVFLASVKGSDHARLDTEHDKYAWKTLSDMQLNELTDFTRVELHLVDVSKKIDQDTREVVINDDKKTTNDTFIIYSDGGSRGNPGPSAAGFVIKDGAEQSISEGGEYLGITTNNQAEYQAVRLALEKALELGAKEIQFRLDSQLVANQLNGIFEIKNRELWPIHAAIKTLIAQFNHVTFTHVRREFNTEADAVVNKILDAQA